MTDQPIETRVPAKTADFTWVEAERLREAMYELASILRVDMPTHATPDDLPYAVNMVRFLTAAIEYLRDLKADANETAASLMVGRVQNLPGIGPVEKQGGYDRKNWDHDELFSLVLARSRDERIADEETGEYEDPAAAFMRVLRDCMGTPSYWKLGDELKKTGLRARGIDADEYCEKTDKRKTVKVPSSAAVHLDDDTGYDTLGLIFQ